MGSLVLLDLMGGVALLLWGLHMVHSGILRAFGPDLRLLLAKALKNRFSAFARGHRPDCAVAKQHRDRPDHEFALPPKGWSAWSRRSRSCSAPMSAPR